MQITDHLQVDLTDPADILEKLPRARELLEAKQQALADLATQVEYWRDLVNVLARIVGEKGVVRPANISPAPAPAKSSAHALITAGRKKRAPSQEKAVEALARYGRPVGPSALFRFMVGEGMDAPKNPNALGANLWNAEKIGRIKKTADGLYAPLEWEADQDLVASRDGYSGEPHTELTENEARDPLSTVAATPEGG